MEFTSLIFPFTKHICRTCLVESDTNMFMNIQDTIEHDSIKVKIIDILVFLNCLENNDEENWPQGMCATCVSTAVSAYSFKLNCLKVNATLSQILAFDASLNMQRADIDAIDINVVYQDHEYDVPLFNHQPSLDLEANLSDNKELTPLPPVTEITSTEQPPRQEAEKKFACNICCKTFTRIFALRYHMAKHTDRCDYLCSKCGKTFYTLNGLRQHAISHKEIAQFKCGFCKKTYKSRQSLKEHFRVAHSTNRKLFSCVMCNKKYTARSTLMMHIKGHNGEKQYACSYCPKTFTRASYLHIHSLVHKGQKRPRPFICNYLNCDRNFSTKHSLLIHIAHTHTAERPHKCTLCTKSFATVSALKQHKGTHNSTNFNCEFCSKTFANKRSLQKHLKVHDVDANDMILETVVDNVFFDQVY